MSHFRHCPKHRKPLPCAHCALAAKKQEPRILRGSSPAERGRKGGRSRSEKKLAAVRENGKRGGRPPLPVAVLRTFPFTPERELLRLNKDVILRSRDESEVKRTAFGITGVRFRPASKEKRLLVFQLKDWKQKEKLARELIRLLWSNKIWAKMRIRREGDEVLVRDRDWERAFALDIDAPRTGPHTRNQSKQAKRAERRAA